MGLALTGDSHSLSHTHSTHTALRVWGQPWVNALALRDPAEEGVHWLDSFDLTWHVLVTTGGQVFGPSP